MGVCRGGKIGLKGLVGLCIGGMAMEWWLAGRGIGLESIGLEMGDMLAI